MSYQAVDVPDNDVPDNDVPEHVQKLKTFSYHTLERFPEPEPILDPTSDFEQMDRGDGFGVDDHPTYHRTER